MAPCCERAANGTGGAARTGSTFQVARNALGAARAAVRLAEVQPARDVTVGV